MEQPGSDYIFLSYADDDSKLARKIHNWLTLTFPKAGCFFAEDDAKRGPKWQVDIEKGLKCCKVAVVLVTPRSRNRDWVNYEVGFCRGRDIRVFPVVPSTSMEHDGKFMRPLQDSSHYVWPDEVTSLANDIDKELQARKFVSKFSGATRPDHFMKEDFVGMDTAQKFIEHLHESLPLQGSQLLKEYFEKDKLGVPSILIDPYLEEYSKAVIAAKHGHVIPLSTQYRVKIAERMLENAAFSVCAISIIGNDPWMSVEDPEKHPYLSLNFKVGNKLPMKVKRLFVCPDDKTKIDEPTRNVIRCMKENQIDTKWITDGRMKSELARYNSPIENLLIVDEKWMTHSNGPGHNGYYSNSKNLIQDNCLQMFNLLWGFAKPLEELLPIQESIKPENGN
jgi:TIR domain